MHEAVALTRPFGRESGRETERGRERERERERKPTFTGATSILGASGEAQ